MSTTPGGDTAKPIETRYHGHKFRSRLEARWAVFFDVAGVPFEYEKEGFELRDEEGTTTWYLPDFWLPDQQSWLEIKGAHPTPEEIEKAWLLERATTKNTYIFYGNIKVPEGDDLPMSASRVLRTPEGLELEEDAAYFWTQFPICERLDIVRGGTMLQLPCKCTDALWNEAYQTLLYSDIPFDDEPISPLATWISAKCDAFQAAHNTPLLIEAYRAARYARFEFGEAGR